MSNLAGLQAVLDFLSASSANVEVALMIVQRIVLEIHGTWRFLWHAPLTEGSDLFFGFGFWVIGGNGRML